MTKDILSTNRIAGLVVIAAGLGIYYFRPAANCNWYNVFCHAGGLLTSPIFFIIASVLVITGAVMIVKG